MDAIMDSAGHRPSFQRLLSRVSSQSTRTVPAKPGSYEPNDGPRLSAGTWVAGSQEGRAQNKRKESGRQPFEVDCSGGQISLDFHVGEAAPDGAREPMPGLGFAMKAL
jgi:hypothetical protein